MNRIPWRLAATFTPSNTWKSAQQDAVEHAPSLWPRETGHQERLKNQEPLHHTLKELETQCCTFTDFLETAPAVNDVMPNLLYYSISSDANEIRCCQSFDRKQPLVNQSRIN